MDGCDSVGWGTLSNWQSFGKEPRSALLARRRCFEASEPLASDYFQKLQTQAGCQTGHGGIDKLLQDFLRPSPLFVWRRIAALTW